MTDAYQKIMGVNWQQYGLRKNPYDTSPLLEGGDLPVDQLFIGREQERDAVDRILASDERACIAICGNVGVGKTSLANLEKYVWKNSRPKLLFSSKREIEATEGNLNKQAFLLNIISSVIRDIELTDPQLIQREPRFIRLKNLVDVVLTIQRSWNVGTNLPVLSANVGNVAVGVNQPIQLTDAIVEAHFNDLIDLVKTNEIDGKKFSGIIVHMNNFDIALSHEGGQEKVLAFFNEIRDLLQHSDVFFLFLGPADFFQAVLAKERRVKAVFSQTPIIVEPLTKIELNKALNARMIAFTATGVKVPVQPVSDEAVSAFYDLYEGDIRSVLSALSDVLKCGTNQVANTLGVDEAMALLARDRYAQIESLLTPELKKILWHLMESREPKTQTELAKELGKQPSNIVKYLKPLKERGVIEMASQEGTSKYLSLSKDFASLRYLVDAERRMQKKAQEAAHQLRLLV